MKCNFFVGVKIRKLLQYKCAKIKINKLYFLIVVQQLINYLNEEKEMGCPIITSDTCLPSHFDVWALYRTKIKQFCKITQNVIFNIFNNFKLSSPFPGLVINIYYFFQASKFWTKMISKFWYKVPLLVRGFRELLIYIAPSTYQG